MVKETHEADEEDAGNQLVNKMTENAGGSDDLKLDVKKHQRARSELAQSNSTSLEEDDGALVIDADDQGKQLTERDYEAKL